MADQRPNLFIVGAMKSFTTSVADALAQHDKIFVPSIKEPHHFNSDLFKNAGLGSRLLTHGFGNIRRIKAREDYLRIYEKAPPDTIYRVDASTSYLYSLEAAKNIYAFEPTSKIVILLRDPVIRAWSEYRMNQSLGIEYHSFRTAVDKDLQSAQTGKINPYKRYIRASLYGDQVQRYLQYFDRSAIFIAVVDDPRQDFQATMDALTAFLDLPAGQTLDALRTGVTRAARLRHLNTIMYYAGIKTLIIRLVPTRLKEAGKAIYYKPDDVAMGAPDQDYLADLLEASTRKLEAITGLDVSHWIRSKTDPASVATPSTRHRDAPRDAHGEMRLEA